MNLNIEIKGRIYQVRPIAPADEALLLEGFDSLSDQARRLRFFAPTPKLSRGQVQYLTSVDQVDHVALGILDEETPVAVGRFIRLDDDSGSADVAITVVDSYQRRGLGFYLLEALATAAISRGVKTLHLDVLAENDSMLGLLERAGAQRVSVEEMIHLTLSSDSVPVPPQAWALLQLLDRAASQRSNQIRQSRHEESLSGVE